jgi:ribonuclease HI
MAWARMSFKGQSVWVKVGAEGRPVLDSDGRAEMKYRQDDKKSYRPAPANLAPAGEAGAAPTPPPDGHARQATATRAAGDATAGRHAGRSMRPRSMAAPAAGAAQDLGTVQVWTDGACSGNPGPMGIGMVVVANGQRVERGEYLGPGTNNIAELTAIARGLQLAAELVPDRDRPVNLYSDSSYALGLLGRGWKAKANQELVASLRRQIAGFPRLRLVKVEGHAGVPDNERCDRLAREAIARGR